MHQSASKIIELYERHAANWDQDRGKALIERTWLDRFLALLPSGGSVLDAGCGSGDPIASYLVGRGFAVTGVDSSPSMIQMCRRRFPLHEWVVADMRTLDLGQKFDGILAWDSLFHLTPEDQRAMFPIFGAHARPGSALMFTSGPAFGEVVASYRGEDLYHASLDPFEYEALLDGIGFQVIGHAREDRDCGGHTVWLARGAISIGIGLAGGTHP